MHAPLTETPWSHVEFPAYPVLVGDITADVAVVGGGISGIITAYLLQEKGLSVTIVEARRCLQAVTGHTTAKVTLVHERIYDLLISTFGKEKALLYAQANQDAIEWIAARAKENECDCVRCSAYLYSPLQSDVDSLRKEFEAVSQLGIPAEWVDKLQATITTEASIKFANQAHINPVVFLRKLLNKFTARGGNVYEHSTVLGVQEASPCTVTTAHGRITANQVVIASHFPAYDPAFYAARLTPHHSYAIMAETSAANAKKWRDMYISDSPSGYMIRQYTQGNKHYLIVSGDGHQVGEGGDYPQHYLNLETFAKQTLGCTKVVETWSTHDHHTPDRVPYIGHISPGSKHVYVATGFGGWGMTHGVVAGKLISALISGEKPPEADLYSPNRFKPIASLPEISKQTASALKHIVGDRFSGRPELDPTGFKPGEARIIELDGEKVAAYRGKDGKLHLLSPSCTHLGCFVSWNNAEETWDCPCHGSRFSATGKVLYGPATEDLPSKEVGVANQPSLSPVPEL